MSSLAALFRLEARCSRRHQLLFPLPLNASINTCRRRHGSSSSSQTQSQSPQHLLSKPALENANPKRVQLFSALKLNQFSEEEILRAYSTIYYNDITNNTASKVELLALLKANNISFANDAQPSSEEFKKEITKLGEQLDSRIWPLGVSFLGTGLSIGIIVPILPLLVEQLHVPPSQFGLIVSAFGLAKLVGNIPSAQWVEKYGRKVVLVNGMLLCSVGIGSIGFSVDPAFGTTSLVISRLITGFGVSAFTSAAFMMLQDISTSLNRTRTMSPVMASFQAGTALGPAIGGFAVTQLGIGPSYYIVGGMIGCLAGLNHLFLSESKFQASPSPAHAQLTTTGSVTTPAPVAPAAAAAVAAAAAAAAAAQGSSFSVARKAWRELLRQKEIRDVVMANTSYWIGLSGTSLTLLPLFMVDLSLTASQIGICFAFSSTVSVLASQPAAILADKWGKEKMICAGLGVLGSSMIALPFATSFESLLVVLAPIALGSTVLSAVPTALMGDLVKPSQRSQALALLRTAGDVGLLVGATASGLSAQFLSLGTTMGANGSLLIAMAGVWGVQRIATSNMQSK